MTYDELLDGWRQSKRRSRPRRLGAPVSVEHEYQGKQWGHPSTYAFVRFECRPADDLTFELQGDWPPQLDADYRRLLLNAMSAAIIDVLVANANPPHTGCAVTCTEVRWDDITSSEMAFYRATRAAMTTLLEQHDSSWS